MKFFPSQVKFLTRAFSSLLSLGLLLGVRTAPAQNRTYPAGANVVNLTRPPYNLKGDGLTDNTIPLQRAMDDYIRTGRILYLPNGTYLISQPLYWRPKSNSFDAAALLMLHGQSEAGTVIRLQDNAAAFQNPADPKALLRTAPLVDGLNYKADSEQGFRNAVRDLTFDTGSGNAGAIGLQFYASNQGTVERVTIKSGDGQGPTGLDESFFGGIGPALFRDVTVRGFDVGVRLRYGYGLVFEGLTLSGQRQLGLDSDGGRTTIRHLRSRNAVPVARLLSSDGVNNLVLLDSQLDGVGAASTQAAIFDNRGYVYARNVTTTGYALAIEKGSPTAGCPNVPNGLVSEYNSHCRYLKLFAGPPDRALQLPIRDIPTVPWDDPATGWANVVDYGADPTGVADATAAVQAAIDAGFPTVYFPNGGTFRLDGFVLLRGATRRVLGNECQVQGSGGLRLVDAGPTDAPVVVVEQFFELFNNSLHLEQASGGRTLVVNSALGFRYDLNGLGDVLVNDITTRNFYPNQAGARVWGRQLNLEYATITNAGARLWIMGMKTEAESTWIVTNGGGSTELIGSFIYASGGQPTVPMFLNNDSNVSLISVVEVANNGRNYGVWVQETRGGVTRQITGSDLYRQGLALSYAGFEPAAPLPVSLTGFEARAAGPRTAELRWATASETNNAGFVVEASAEGRVFKPLATVPGAPGGSSATPRTYGYRDELPATELPAARRYYRLRQLDQDGAATYSAVRVVEFGNQNNLLQVSVFPNPSTASSTTLRVLAPAAGAAQVRVLDALGRVHSQARYAAQAGANAWPMALPAGPGVYVVEVSLNGQVSRQRLVRD